MDLLFIKVRVPMYPCIDLSVRRHTADFGLVFYRNILRDLTRSEFDIAPFSPMGMCGMYKWSALASGFPGFT